MLKIISDPFYLWLIQTIPFGLGKLIPTQPHQIKWINNEWTLKKNMGRYNCAPITTQSQTNLPGANKSFGLLKHLHFTKDERLPKTIIKF